jgi:tryptophan synthase beta subunit
MIEYYKTQLLDHLNEMLNEYNNTTNEYFCFCSSTEKFYNDYSMRTYKKRKISDKIKCRIFLKGEHIKTLHDTPEKVNAIFWEIATR